MVILNIIQIVGVVIGYRSLKESVMSRDASLLIWAIERMSSIKSDLHTLKHAPPYSKLEDVLVDDFKTPWSEATELAAQNVSVELQRLAYMANSGLISKVHFEKMWGKTFLDAWNMLEIWVKRRRFINNEPIELNDGAVSRRDFEIFAKEQR